MLLAAGCYNDSKIREQLEDHERRILALEQLCAQMNTNITSMQAILAALQNNDFVTDVAAITENGVEIGYTITFSKSGAVTIYHGKDGYSPVLGVRQDADGVWYWTLDGEWLLDGQGSKVKASGTDGQDGRDGEDGQDGQDGESGQDGADGVSPLLKIVGDNWLISYDGGKTWTLLGAAAGADGADGTSFFKSVTQEGYTLILVLADNTSITLPMRRPLSVKYTPEVERDLHLHSTPSGPVYIPTDTLIVTPNQVFKIDYLITSDAPAVQVEVTTSSDVQAVREADPDNKLAGSITVEMGSTVGAFSALNVFVSDGWTLLIEKFYFIETD